VKVIASYNGLAAAERTFALLRDGVDLLNACVEGVVLVEDDPDELTVGYGGLPNAEGIVELDAAVMDGRSHRVGGVAALRNVRNPSRVALRVLQKTNRVLLVGEGALQFARAEGFAEENLLTEKARKIWEHWRSTKDGEWRPAADAQLDPDVAAYLATHSERPWGTVHLAARDARGDVACVTSTSGHAFKPAGRVGDSPIAGAGLYADNAGGTCGSLGHGESNLQNCSSFLAVELMRGGMPPLEAGLAALRRIELHAAPHERDAAGRVKIDVRLYLLAADGRHAGVSLQPGNRMIIVEDGTPRVEPCTPL
jgi:N4-(beta-N-acetylglucosaminyl)-L-asparaginase